MRQILDHKNEKEFPSYALALVQSAYDFPINHIQILERLVRTSPITPQESDQAQPGLAQSIGR
jgi:hypothetical protein